MRLATAGGMMALLAAEPACAADGFNGTSINNAAPIAGTPGTPGNLGTSQPGTDGGNGAVVTGSSRSSNTSTITGGTGGTGGTGAEQIGSGGPGAFFAGSGGPPGKGGDGVSFTANGVTFTNSGAVTAGNSAGTNGAVADVVATGGTFASLFLTSGSGSSGVGGTGASFSGNNATFANSGSVVGGSATYGSAGHATGVVNGQGAFDGSSTILAGSGGSGFAPIFGLPFYQGPGSAVEFTGRNASFVNSGTVVGGSSGAAGAGGNATLTFVVGNVDSLNVNVTAGGGGGEAYGATAVRFTQTGGRLTNSGTITAGNGAAGADGGSATANITGSLGRVFVTAGSGGSGGDGGMGVENRSGIVTIVNSGAIAGGNGAAGGAGGSVSVTTSGGVTVAFASGGGQGGRGGNGGAGISSIGGAITNSGSITGGNGAAAGAGGHSNIGANGADGAVGTGGAGVFAISTALINSGTIQGGLAGDGVTRANAVTFFSGTNLLQLQAGSNIIGTVQGTGSDIFQLGGNGTASFASSQIDAEYLGFNTFEKLGNGVWTLTGNDPSSRAWAVNAGTLSVAGALGGSAFTVNNGGTLGGTGTTGAVTVNSGGTLAPGANGAPGTLTIGGNLAFQAGSFYLAQLNPTTVLLADVDGSANLTGGTVKIGGLAKFNTAYTILHADGGLGGTTFAGVIMPNISLQLGYSATDVTLTINAVTLGLGTTLNPNQQAVANSINDVFNKSGTLPTGGILPLFGLTGTALANALTQVSGEVATGSQQTTFDAMTLFMGMLTDPFIGGRDGFGGVVAAVPFADESMAYAAGRTRSEREREAYAAVHSKAPQVAAFVPRWSVWAAGFTGQQSTSGNAIVGTQNTNSSIYGGTVGADYRFSPSTIAGFALAGGGTNFRTGNLGDGHSDLFQAGAFIRHTMDAAYVTGALAYGWQDIVTDRFVRVAGLDHLRARFNANTWSARLEGGYRFDVQGLGFTPYAAGQYTAFELPAYAEQAVLGSNAFALAYNARTVSNTRSELGIRADRSFTLKDSIFTLRGRAAWAHDFDPSREAAATFQTLPGASFVVNGAAMAPNSALTSASAEWKWRNGISAAATFEGEFSELTRSYAGKGVVRYTW